MNDLLSAEALNLFLLMVAPGFVAVKVYDLFIPAPRRNFSESAVELIAYSFFNYVAIVSFAEPYLTAEAKEANPVRSRLLMLGVLLVAPALEGWAVVVVRRSRRLRSLVSLLHPTPSGWDYLFGQGRPLWLLFTLKSGTRVGGYFGPNSFASSFPEPEQVYVEQLWRLNEQGQFVGEVQGSAGGVICMKDCDLLEVFHVEEQANERGQEEWEIRRLSTSEEGVSAINNTNSAPKAPSGG